MPLSLSAIVTGFQIVPNTSVYTDITSVEFSATYSGELLDFNAIWIFGDGTYHASTDTSVSHRYTKAGTYNTKLIVFNTVEEYRRYLLENSLSLGLLPTATQYFSFTQQLTVTNFIQDSISVTVPAGVHQSRTQDTPFRVNFQTSKNVVPKFQLYAKNSASQPWHLTEPKWSHLKPCWRFLDTNKQVADIVSPLTANLKSLVKSGDTTVSATAFDTTIPTTLVAGTSGFVDFYYVDDLPGIVSLFVTLDTSEYANPTTVEYDANIAAYSNSTVQLSAAYTVSESTPNKLYITSNGIPTFAIDGVKWKNALVPYVIAVTDVDGYILKNYPLTNNLGKIYPITRSLSGVNNSNVAFELPTAYFQRYDTAGFDTGGYYTGFFQPLTSCNNTQLMASVTLQTSTGLISLSGSSDTFSILSYEDAYSIRKYNESYDMASAIHSYALQETIADNKVLFDDLIGQIVGDVNSAPESLGKSIYEKIANYVGNHADIDTCNIDQLYSLCAELNIPIENYNLLFPANLKRIMDILSISYSRLKGSRNTFNRDFNLNASLYSAQNLGNALNTETYNVSAGVPIVVREKHTDSYELINPVIIQGLSVYPISSLAATYNYRTPVDTYYKFYEFVSSPDDTQLDGVINWDDPDTTLPENITSIDKWVGQSGIVDTILDYQLRKGLELISN